MTGTVPVLVLGGTGQIGYEMIRTLAWLGPITAPTRAEVNLADLSAVRTLVRDRAPAMVVNAAAYTAVDAAESDADACMRLNAELPEILGDECKRVGALLVHFSSDYIFDGAKRSPYVETDAPNPLGLYGRSKLAGDLAIAASGAAHLIFRTSWVYSARGKNFARTMLRMAREREELRVVNDQVGAPTSAPAVAAGVSGVLRVLSADRDFHAATEDASGVYHMTAGGSTTWFEFAKAVIGADRRASEQRCRAIVPIPSAEYPTAAKRPAYSVLDNSKLASRFGVRLSNWKDSLEALGLSS
jgi:dTDP-4-dehydrorhamnose reductase